jgi:hypothetical protein
MVAVHPNVKYGGAETADDSSPRSMRRAAALAANPLPYIARMVTCNASGLITVTREDGGDDDIVYCVAGHNPYRFIRLVADAGSIVEDVHF